MNDCNPYESSMVSDRSRPETDGPIAVKQLLGSVGCLAIGAGLSWGMPFVLAYAGLWRPGIGDLSGLFIYFYCICASIVAGAAGFVAGSLRPGRQAILATMACVVLTDFVALALSPRSSSAEQFYLLYLVSAIVKVAAMKLIAPRGAEWSHRVLSLTGAVLLFCIVQRLMA
jgi:hypothetical protein